MMTAEADLPDTAIDPGDILLAAQSSCAVLITAPPQAALEIALTIAVERGCADRLLVDDLMVAGSGRADVTDMPHGPLMLLLREVQELTPRQQALLLELMEDRHGTPPRIIASSSVSLFDRVQQGAFDAQLFYRLNTVHVMATRRAGV
jgi:hypothetical protein